MPHAGPQARPRQMVRPGPQPQIGPNTPPRHVGSPAPKQVAFLRAPSRGTPFRPTQSGGGGGLSLGAMFGDNNGLGSQQRQPAGSYRCVGRLDTATGQRRPCAMGGNSGLGVALQMGIDDYRMPGGEGPLCENCWADSWVRHKMQNNPSMPDCQFGVQFTEAEWQKMQQAIHSTIQDFLSPVDMQGRPRQNYQPRYPTPQEINQVLQQFKWSRDCPRCAKLLKGAKVPVSFYPDANDFQIAGVNAPIQ